MHIVHIVLKSQNFEASCFFSSTKQIGQTGSLLSSSIASIRSSVLSNGQAPGHMYCVVQLTGFNRKHETRAARDSNKIHEYLVIFTNLWIWIWQNLAHCLAELIVSQLLNGFEFRICNLIFERENELLADDFRLPSNLKIIWRKIIIRQRIW